MFKSARKAGFDALVYTTNANNPGTPKQLGAYGVDKVGVLWNWAQNAPTPQLEKIAVADKKKYKEDFIFAAHPNSMHMVRMTLVQAGATDPLYVALASKG